MQENGQSKRFKQGALCMRQHKIYLKSRAPMGKNKNSCAITSCVTQDSYLTFLCLNFLVLLKGDHKMRYCMQSRQPSNWHLTLLQILICLLVIFVSLHIDEILRLCTDSSAQPGMQNFISVIVFFLSCHGLGDMQTVTQRIFFFFPVVPISKTDDIISYHASCTHHNEPGIERCTGKREKSTVLPESVLSSC